MRLPSVRSILRASGVTLRVSAWAFVLAVWAALLFAHLLPQDFRNTSRPYVYCAWLALALRVIQPHLGLLLVPIALVSAFIRGRRLFVAAVIPCLFTLVPWLLQYAPRDTPVPPPPGAVRLKVMTANVMIMNDWYVPLLGQAREWRPDVLLIQEFAPDWMDALRAEMNVAYPHQLLAPSATDSAGLGLYSRHAIRVASDTVAPGRDGRRQQRVELDVGGGRLVAVYNIHLKSPLSADAVADARLAFAQLLDALAAERLPVVVAGDFNFPDTAPQHAALKRLGLREAHEEAGKARGATWPARGLMTRIPGWRIDHVYFSHHFRALSCETGRFTSSDHLPVVAELVLK